MEIYGKYLGKNVFIVFEMLCCFVVEICLMLDEMNIFKDDSYIVEEMSIFFELGIIILIEVYYLFKIVFEELFLVRL